MADVVRAEFSDPAVGLVEKRFRDMGDGTHAEVVSGTVSIDGIDVGEDGMPVVPQISTSASGGPLIHKIVSAASTNAVLIGGAGPKKLIDLVISNAHSGVQVIHFYDTDATPVPGTTPTRFTLCMPAGFCGSIVFGTPKIFELGMGMSITGAATDADDTNATADKVHGELSYIEAE